MLEFTQFFLLYDGSLLQKITEFSEIWVVFLEFFLFIGELLFWLKLNVLENQVHCGESLIFFLKNKILIKNTYLNDILGLQWYKIKGKNEYLYLEDVYSPFMWKLTTFSVHKISHLIFLNFNLLESLFSTFKTEKIHQIKLNNSNRNYVSLYFLRCRGLGTASCFSYFSITRRTEDSLLSSLGRLARILSLSIFSRVSISPSKSSGHTSKSN